MDERQIYQAVSNVLINADQAMPEGGVVDIKAENAVLTEEMGSLPLKMGEYIKVSIGDQGVGIPGKYLHKIFDPYFITKERKSGLGLAITYSIIKKHEGYITAESEVGVGTIFYIYLPASDKEVFPVKEIKKKTGGDQKKSFRP